MEKGVLLWRPLMWQPLIAAAERKRRRGVKSQESDESIIWLDNHWATDRNRLQIEGQIINTFTRPLLAEISNTLVKLLSPSICASLDQFALVEYSA